MSSDRIADGEVAAWLRTEEGQRGYLAGLEISTRLLEDIAGRPGLFVWSADLRAAARSWRKSIELISAPYRCAPADDVKGTR